MNVRGELAAAVGMAKDVSTEGKEGAEGLEGNVPAGADDLGIRVSMGGCEGITQ